MINSSWKLVIRIFRTVAKGIRIFLFQSRSKKSWNECLLALFNSSATTVSVSQKLSLILVALKRSDYTFSVLYSWCSVYQLSVIMQSFLADKQIQLHLHVLSGNLVNIQIYLPSISQWGITIFTDNSRWLEAKHIITMRYFWYYTGFFFSTITENVGFILQRLKADSALPPCFFNFAALFHVD